MVTEAFNAPDEPIRRQRETVSTLENIAELISHQTERLTNQHELRLAALKRIAGIGLAVLLVLAVYVFRHW